MPSAQAASLGSTIKHVSFTMTNTAKTIKQWMADSSARDLDTNAVPAFSMDNLVSAMLTNYTGTLNYGGSNTQPIAWPANADFSLPSCQFADSTYVKTSAATFTVYAILVFGSQQ